MPVLPYNFYLNLISPREDHVHQTTGANNLLVGLLLLANNQAHLTVVPILRVPPSFFPVHDTCQLPGLRWVVRYHDIAKVHITVAEAYRAVVGE